MLLYPTFIPNQIHYIMLGIKLGIKIKNFKLSYKVSSFPFAFSGIGFSVSPPATFAFITSSFAFRDTLSAGTSAYCLMLLSCPIPIVFSASGVFFAGRSATSFRSLELPAHHPYQSRHYPFYPC